MRARSGAKPWSVLVALAMVLSLLTFGVFSMPMAAADEIDEATGQETESGAPAEVPEVVQSGEESSQGDQTLGSLVKSLIQPRIGGWGPVTGPAAAGWAANTGDSTWIDSGFQMTNFSGTGETLQQFAPFRVGGPDAPREWCVDLEASPPVGAGELVSLGLKKFAGIPATYQVDTATQMAYILRAYGESADVLTSSAVAVLVHLNYDVSSSATVLSNLVATLEADPVQIAAKAREIVAAAKANAGEYFTGGRMTVAPNQQDFTVTDIGVQQMPAGNFLGGYDVIVTITSANAVFEQSKVPNGTVSSDGKTWTGKTVQGSAVNLGGRSSDNGEIVVNVQYKSVPLDRVQGFNRPNNSQSTVQFKPGADDPRVGTEPAEIVRDFQPVLISSVTNAGYTQVAAGTKVLKDELTVSADQSYAQTEWLGMGRTFPGQDEYKPLPVTFKGTAYKIDTPLASPAATVPAGAVKVAETTITATDGPGTYVAEADYSGEAGYVTWVWEVDKTDQPHIVTDELYMIHADWADSFGLKDETTTIVDFQPMLTSSTDGAASKVVAPGTKVLKDELTVFADPNHQFTDWLGSGSKLPSDAGYKPLPVKFRGTAYDVGQLPIGKGGKVPADAVKVAETTIIANGPGTYTAEAKYSGDPRFVTWVWEVDKADQPQLSAAELQMIHSNWADAYGVASEQTSIQWPGKIESNLKIHPTNDNTYLVDDAWISGLPKTHPTFEGGYGFGADAKEIVQSLVFWPGLTMDEVTSLDGSEEIASVEIPAKNGFYPSVGDLEFKLQRDADGELLVGTYQFVHSFVGDDRVAAFTSQVPDVNEMYEVTAEPQISTTAMGEVDDMVGAFEDVTITDTVCYLNLKPGKEYELKGTLKDQATGEDLLVNGKPVVASKKFTPTAKEGCEDLEFTFNASALAGKTTVVFEDLYQDGVVVATHSDIEDEGQTIYIPEIKTTATAPDGGKLIEKAKDQKITDTVCYTGLKAGKEYGLEGILMDQTTGKPLEIGGKQVTSTAKFTPTGKEGCEDIEFTFDASGLKGGQSLVVFEDLYQGDVKIAVHADITDKGQTVTVKGERLPETGAAGTIAMTVIGLGLVGGGLALVLRRKSSGEVA